MKHISIQIIFAVFIGLIIAACSDVRDDLTSPASVSVHKSGVLTSASTDFHGNLLIGKKDFSDCQKCHSADLSGGTAGVSCATDNCHPTVSIHQGNIVSPDSPNFHAKYMQTHGYKMSQCKQCHGDNFQGQIASPTCQTCHSTITVHKDGDKSPSSDNFHGKYIMANNFDMSGCRDCHGATYAGGLISISCNNCHKDPGGPEACNTCHGDFNTTGHSAPGRAINGETSTTYPGVGAHASHLYTTTLSSNVVCSDCHTVPDKVSSPGHIENSPAEVKLSSQPANASYDYNTNKCANTYCHGNFSFPKSATQYDFAYTADAMTGNNFTPTWTKVDGTQAECGSCHGLPPAGHFAVGIEHCGDCHIGVVDDAGHIIDQTKHINGKIDVFGREE